MTKAEKQKLASFQLMLGRRKATNRVVKYEESCPDHQERMAIIDERSQKRAQKIEDAIQKIDDIDSEHREHVAEPTAIIQGMRRKNSLITHGRGKEKKSSLYPTVKTVKSDS